MGNSDRSTAVNATEGGGGLSPKRWFVMLLKAFGGLLAVVVILLVIASIVGVRIPIYRLSGFLSPVVEGLGATAEYAEGSYVELSLTPAIRLEDFRLTSEHSVLAVARLSGAVELLPLFQQKLVIRDARLETGRLELSRQSGQDDRPARAEASDPAESPFELSPWLRSLVVDTARITDVTALVRHEDSGAEWTFAVVDLSLTMPKPGDVTATVGGSFQGLGFDLEARSRRRSDADWALEELKLEGEGFGMRLSGQADPRGGSAAGLFHASVERSAAIEAVFGTSLVPYSPLVLRADWDFAEGRGNLVFNELRVGSSRFDGYIALDTNGPVPVLTIDAEAPSIDLAEWTERLAAASEPAGGAGPQSERPRTAGGEQPPLAEMLNPLLERARIKTEVRIGAVDGALLPVTDLLLGLSIEDEILTFPVAVTIAQVPFRGAIAVETEGELVRLSAPLIGLPSDAGELLRLLFAVDDLAGSHEGLEVVTRAEGRTLAELVDSVRMTGTVEGARLSYGTRPVNFSLDAMDLESSMHEPTAVSASGELLGQPFEITARSDSLAELADRQDMQFEAVVTGPGTRLAAAAARTESQLTVDLELESSDAGVMRDWLALYPAEPTTLALGVRLARNAGSEGLEYVIDPLRVGRSDARLTGVLERPAGQAALSAEVRGDRVDVDDVMNLFAAAPAGRNPPAEKRSGPLALDAPILPAKVSIFDADLDVLLGQLAYRGLDLTDISVVGRTRDGVVKSAAVSAETAYGSLNGSASADLRTNEPNLRASLEVAPFRFGRLLEDLGFVESSTLSFAGGAVDLELAGETLDDLLRSARLDMRLSGGRIPLVPEFGVEAAVDEASLRAAPGEPIELTVTGDVRDELLDVDLRVTPLAELLDTRILGMRLDGRLGDVGLDAEFGAPMPLGRGLADLRVNAEAAGLDAWNSLLGINLPPWGPVALSGDLAHQQSAYRLDDFRVAVGESALGGRVDLDLAGKPRLDVRLTAPMIQLEDFGTEGWEATGAASPEPSGPAAGEAAEGPEETASAVVSRETFERLDATLVLDVNEVRSGADRLGAGQLRAHLLDGVFEVPTLLVQTPAGDVTAESRLAWAGPQTVDASVALRAENFDYGILARRIDPASTMKGELTINADLRSRYPAGQPFMSGAEGVLQFGVWPEDFRAGVFDLWAVGLLSAVMPKFSKDAVSTMNCLIGKFRVTDGVLSQDVFLADSSKVRVTGEAEADFRAREVDAYLSPEAKRAQIFSFGAPLEIAGEFDSYSVGMRGGDLALAVLRFITSPVVAPIRWLIEEPLPADGEAACRGAWETAGPQRDAQASPPPESGGPDSVDELDSRSSN